MNLPVLGPIKEFIKIPAIFHSYSTGKPFEECISCQKHLLHNGRQYVVEKAMVHYAKLQAVDVIYEYAICMECTGEVYRSLSETSRQDIAGYFERHVDFVSRREKLLRTTGCQVNGWIESCLIKGTPRARLDTYHLFAHCDGEDLLFSYLPYMISGQAVEEMAELLSAETKQVLDHFIDQYFGLPPALKQLVKEHKAILL